MNILEIVVIVLTVLLAFWGFKKGFALRLASMLSLVISITLVSVLLPTITEFIKTSTPIYDYIVKECRHVIAEQFVESYLNENPGQATFFKGIEELQLDSYLGDYKEDILENVKLTKVEQNAVIDQLPFPEKLRSMLLDYNNDEGYKRLKVSTFQEYIVNFIATAILNVISYIVCILIVQLLLKALFTTLNIISHIPVIGFVNRLLGMALGLLEALFLLWIFFLVLSMLVATPIGMEIFNMVEESSFLGYLYDSNLFLKLALGAAAIFL